LVPDDRRHDDDGRNCPEHTSVRTDENRRVFRDNLYTAVMCLPGVHPPRGSVVRVATPRRCTCHLSTSENGQRGRRSCYCINTVCRQRAWTNESVLLDTLSVDVANAGRARSSSINNENKGKTVKCLDNVDIYIYSEIFNRPKQVGEYIFFKFETARIAVYDGSRCRRTLLVTPFLTP